MGTQDGMMTMEKYAQALTQAGIIEEKEYMGYLVNENT